MSKLIILGAGGHARSCIDVIETSSNIKIYGLIHNESNKVSINKHKFVGKDTDLKSIYSIVKNAHVAIGGVKNITLRGDLFKKIKKIGFKTPKIISKFSYVSNKSFIGPGSIIMHNSLINYGSRIGLNCIINSKALIEHDVTIGDNCHIAPGAILNGGVVLENNVFIGAGAIIFPGLKISANKIVPAGKILKTNL